MIKVSPYDVLVLSIVDAQGCLLGFLEFSHSAQRPNGRPRYGTDQCSNYGRLASDVPGLPLQCQHLLYARDCILVPDVLVLPTFNLVTRIACSCVMTGRRPCRMANSIHGHQSRPPATRSPEREPQNKAL